MLWLRCKNRRTLCDHDERLAEIFAEIQDIEMRMKMSEETKDYFPDSPRLERQNAMYPIYNSHDEIF